MSRIDCWQLHKNLTRSVGGYATDESQMHNSSRTIYYSENYRYFFEALQECRIILTGNGKLVIVPGAVQCGDVICIFSGTISACALRPEMDGSWSLISGDCHIFGMDFRDQDWPSIPFGDEYVRHHDSVAEEFRIR
jgi:hypothetical protein